LTGDLVEFAFAGSEDRAQVLDEVFEHPSFHQQERASVADDLGPERAMCLDGCSSDPG
jgi:hypothetical protein